MERWTDVPRDLEEHGVRGVDVLPLSLGCTFLEVPNLDHQLRVSGTAPAIEPKE